jgi:hypothetical protein
MKLLGIVVIAILVVLLSHWTLENLLMAKPRASQSPSTSGELLAFVRDSINKVVTGGAPLTNVKASNYYATDHPSDIHSEATDLSKFFEVQQSVPDTNEILREVNRQSGVCAGGVDAYGRCLPATDALLDAQQGTPLRFDFGSDGSATMMPDHWSYQDENVMNGGVLDGVRAFDNQLSDYTVYPSNDATKPEGLWTSSYPYVQSFGKW